mgnify:FL=1
MKCELVFVGTELLLGDILNTNAQYLSKKLAALGFDVMFQSVVGDNPERLRFVLEEALSRSDVIITTGGLGPTKDDLTKEICAGVFGLPLEMHKESLERIHEYFKAKNVPMPKSNEKQALMPRGSVVFKNNNGTAPGCAMEKDGKHIIILPGPPREMHMMFEEGALPYLRRFSDHVIISHSVRTFGIGESLMAEKAGNLLDMQNPTVAPYAKSGEALLRVTAKCENEKQAEALISPVVEEIKSRLGSMVYGIDLSSMEQAVVSLLKEKKLTVATAESCTGGLISKRLTDISGASEVFGCGVVSYSNEVKEKLLGVKREHLEKYGAVSEAVAASMALGVQRLSGADIGVSVTGIAGPSSDCTNKPVGLVYIAVTDGSSYRLKKLTTGHAEKGCRDYNRTVSASTALNEVRLFVLEKENASKDINAFINSF